MPPSPLEQKIALLYLLFLEFLNIPQNLIKPAELRAVYSPKECPAKNNILFESKLNSLVNNVYIE